MGNEEKVQGAIKNLNEQGLELVLKIVTNMEQVEKYNANTSRERIAEIIAIEEQERAQEVMSAQREFMEQMRQKIAERKAKIERLSGKEKVFWNKIEKIKALPDIRRYSMSYWQIELLASLYDNNYINANYDGFCFGFYQGMQYLKNKQKKNNKKK